ncbi:Sucrose transport protein [Arachis hypogaea]|uniref:Uncharacterized protein n=1 Tax=Arachis hypogaea TaxID=3818 RepID=A0A444ZL44_ARAHY|nr:Sucrose transport protein [Arachis hypogaea]RYR14891.1 hypothetical protein Ahy_B04g071590 [Arachis hypogaea]
MSSRGLPPSKASPLCAHFRIPSSLCPTPSTSLQTLFFVSSYIPSSLIAMSSPTESGSTLAEPISLWKLILVASIVVGIHLVNAVQIAWLIPIYVAFRIPDKWTSLVWLVGAVSSSVFHPLLSYYNNTCKLGWQHRPFIFAGVVGATIAFDNWIRQRHWMLEISINMIDARCKDFLDDLASRDQPKIRLAY